MDVSDKLLQSMSLHYRAQPLRGDERVRLWREAYALRKQAHEEDPDHLSPAWAAEQESTPRGYDTHMELMTFYREKLGE